MQAHDLVGPDRSAPTKCCHVATLKATKAGPPAAAGRRTRQESDISDAESVSQIGLVRVPIRTSAYKKVQENAKMALPASQPWQLRNILSI